MRAATMNAGIVLVLGGLGVIGVLHHCVRSRSLVGLILVMLCMGVFAGTGHAQAPLRIMPLGDSLTNGGETVGGYRYPLYLGLESLGWDFTFVGSMTDNAPPGLPYPNHEGHNGYCISAMNGRVGLLENMGSWLDQANPDVVLLMIGTNDMDAMGTTHTIADRLTALGQVIDDILAHSATTAVFVAQIPPFTSWQYLYNNVTQYNAGIPAVVAARAQAGRVYVVDQFTGFNVATDTYDTVHPNASGALKVANRWEAALAASGIGNPAIPGDFNKDGQVGPEDFGILKDHFGVMGLAHGNHESWALGDANDDGQIGPEDFGDLKDYFGASGGPTGAYPLSKVPEPATLSLLALGGLAMLRRRR